MALNQTTIGRRRSLIKVGRRLLPIASESASASAQKQKKKKRRSFVKGKLSFVAIVPFFEVTSQKMTLAVDFAEEGEEPAAVGDDGGDDESGSGLWEEGAYSGRIQWAGLDDDERRGQ